MTGGAGILPALYLLCKKRSPFQSKSAPVSHPKSHAGDRPFIPKVRPSPIPNLTRAIGLSVQKRDRLYVTSIPLTLLSNCKFILQN
ncbi:hypothetical protein QUB60_05580 [Microcoleus sp. A2-C5]|uniref:hypothetical protein n=1 Tax=unclassified Microcoleus TaxID=2642155 RepID=UPI002FD2CA22